MKFNQIIKYIAISIMIMLLLTGLGCFIAGATLTGSTNNAQALQDAGFTLLALSNVGLFITHYLKLKDDANDKKDDTI